MARRGFFAELQHQSRLAARERERGERAAVRAHNAAFRDAERARKSEERLQTKLLGLAVAERKRAEKEARDAHLASMEAEVEQRNRKLQEQLDDLSSLLEGTLQMDDHVDLNTLRGTATHPPFDRPHLETPIPKPRLETDKPTPSYSEPTPPTGLLGLFGKGKHAVAVEAARRAHEEAMTAWRKDCEQSRALHQAALAKYANDEKHRIDSLEKEQSKYAQECAARDQEVAGRNAQLDQLIVDLGYGTPDAIHEYLSIVLSNSAYPECFNVTHEFQFDPVPAELKLQVFIPGPDCIPKEKGFKYTKNSDEITALPQTQKVLRDLYSDAVLQVALRSFHEVFESDRRGLVRTVSLEVGTEATDPATGQIGYIRFVAAAAARDTFLSFNLSGVVPASTLERLGAAVSKSPYSLVAIQASGVRRA